MPSDSSLFSLARNKLQSVVGGNAKDSDSLHRWVLLKNSIIRTAPLPAAQSAQVRVDPDTVHKPLEVMVDSEQDAFMFPDPDTLLGSSDLELDPREDQWLDSVLEDLIDNEDDDAEMALDDSLSTSLRREDDEPLSPLYSPMSSSDDLVDQSNYYYPSSFVPYPVPYPPLHPPLIPSWFESDAGIDPMLSPSPPLYHDPLPYYDTDDLEDLPVPDAIEDTSDDESDAPSTPATTSTSSLSSSPTSPLARERTRLLPEPHIYVNKDDSFFASFELDPLPFPSDQRREGVRAYRRPVCQEC
ncbi:hypothetical protein EUX98_g339 [Antrodiella citrinella]|uniref:Uncharacterized protein n=1 Tax=Antrodiella citrinella TaxID=2447956 RepID=A0A4S4N4K3_9APHY|nr:hypothetical protein EUX98_g339 [Antrodiella citrinella]